MHELQPPAHMTAMTTQTPNPKPTSRQISRLRELATETESITDSYYHYLDDDLPQEWATFMTHALSQVGLKFSTKYEFGDLRGGYYDAITPGANGITYSGVIHYQGNGSESDSYTIPWGFIDPERRAMVEENILADLRKEKVEKDAAAAKNAEIQAEHQRRQKIKQLEDLAASLGMKVTDA